MQTILVHAQTLVYSLLSLMPTAYQRDNLQAMLGLFLQAEGKPLPEYSFRQVPECPKPGTTGTLGWFVFPRYALLVVPQTRWQIGETICPIHSSLKGSTITWWGKRRWAIEGFFKTSKHRFGLHRFGQGTRLGVYRWLVLSLIAFTLAHWAYLSTNPSELPDWGACAPESIANSITYSGGVPPFT